MVRLNHMSQKLILIWSWITVAMIGLLGLMFVFNPAVAASPGTTALDLAQLLGLKNTVYAGLILYALLKKNQPLLVVLLIGRGITDILDGGFSIATGHMDVPYFMAFTTGVISLVAGYLLSKQSKTQSA